VAIPRGLRPIDVASKTNVRVDVEPQPYLTFTTTGAADSTWLTVKWKQGGRRLYFTHAIRGAKRIQLMEAHEDGAGETDREGLACDTRRAEPRHRGRQAELGCDPRRGRM
jgi:hypothetical protein